MAKHPEGEVARLSLGHGDDPAEVLASRGWVVAQVAGLSVASRAELVDRDPWRFEFVFDVTAGPAIPLHRRTVPRDAGLASSDLITVRPYRRVAAYAIVESVRGVLLTELSGHTNAPGSWTLPGGGLDQGERVGAGLAREVWEESGAQLSEVTLHGVQTSHWIGRAPNGGIEDYHAIRIVHRASCPDPQEPVIHDIGGSTSDARWVAWDALDTLPIVPTFAPALRRLAADRRGTSG